MYICSLSTIKTLLQITTTNDDALITALMPIVQQDLFDYLFNDFNPEYSYLTTGETLGNGTTGFSTFTFNEDIYKVKTFLVDGSSVNWDEGATQDYILKRQENKIIIRTTSFTSSNELKVDYYYPEYPFGIKLIYADMINWRIKDNRNDGYKSENISRYSYTKEDMKVGGYPESIIRHADKFKKVDWGWN